MILVLNQREYMHIFSILLFSIISNTALFVKYCTMEMNRAKMFQKLKRKIYFDIKQQRLYTKAFIAVHCLTYL